MHRAPRTVALACAAALVVAACGGDDTTSDTASPTAPATEAPGVTEVPATTSAPETTSAPDTMAPETTMPEAELGSIVEVAAAAGQFTTLLAAVEAAGLAEQLATQQVTLLAPTDDAFAALGQEAIDALLADPARLTDVLEGHVLPSPQDAELISIFNNVIALNGASWTVTATDDTLMIGGATVVTPDLMADNGIIHAIDSVLLPAEAPAG